MVNLFVDGVAMVLKQTMLWSVSLLIVWPWFSNKQITHAAVSFFVNGVDMVLRRKQQHFGYSFCCWCGHRNDHTVQLS